MKAKRLGRGLGNLISRTEPEPFVAAAPEARGVPIGGDGAAGSVRWIPVAAIRSNPYQPRTTFSPEALDELCTSIRDHGMLQPVVVRPVAEGFELVAGERRLRAAQLLALPRVPALIRDASEEDLQTLALVENLQREDLNALEKARALRTMMENLGLRQEDVAARVGKARTTVANLLRLLDLPEEIQRMVEEGRLSGAHARAVLQAQGTKRRVELARRAAEQGWSVREIERRARSGPTVGRRRTRPEDPYVRDLEERLRRALSAEVRLLTKGAGGRIDIRYADADDLDRLLELLQA